MNDFCPRCGYDEFKFLLDKNCVLKVYCAQCGKYITVCRPIKVEQTERGKRVKEEEDE